MTGLLVIDAQLGAHLAIVLARGLPDYRAYCRANGVAERPEVAGLRELLPSEMPKPDLRRRRCLGGSPGG